MKRRLTVGLAAGAVVAVGGAWLVAAPLLGAESQASDLAEALARGGTTFEPVGHPSFVASFGPSIDEDKAKSMASDEFPYGGETQVFTGLLTVPDHEPTISRRPVFAVQITGLEMPPMGSYPGTDITPESIHHELVVFVDASSGAWLLAETVR